MHFHFVAAEAENAKRKTSILAETATALMVAKEGDFFYAS
jgi:hypothetical protein